MRDGHAAGYAVAYPAVPAAPAHRFANDKRRAAALPRDWSAACWCWAVAAAVNRRHGFVDIGFQHRELWRVQRDAHRAVQIVGHADVLRGEHAVLVPQDQIRRQRHSVAGVAHRTGVHQKTPLMRQHKGVVRIAHQGDVVRAEAIERLFHIVAGVVEHRRDHAVDGKAPVVHQHRPAAEVDLQRFGQAQQIGAILCAQPLSIIGSAEALHVLSVQHELVPVAVNRA